MTNRTEEYWALVSELSQPPQALEGSVGRARKRAQRSRFARRLAAPAASLAAVAASFVLLVNVFPSFALACSGVPIIRELTAAVAFSPSLSAAVAHDYVQYIGQSQTVDGVTVRLEYAIADRDQVVFFYSVDGNARFHTSPSLTGPDGEAIGGYATASSHYDGQDGLEAMTLSFTAGARLPDRFTLEMFLKALPDQDQASEPAAPADTLAGEEPEDRDPREDPDVLRFAFDVSLDPARICEPRTIQADQWLELDGQRIQVEQLTISPTRTVLYLGEDSANTAWLKSLKFWFEDGQGNRYDDIDGNLSASGEAGSQSYLTYYFQSFYYDQPESLTLCVGKAEWLDKDTPHVILDLTTGACTGLPNGVEVAEITRSGADVTVKLLSPLVRREFAQTFGYSYWDPEGGEHAFHQWTGGTEFDSEGRETVLTEQIFLDDYPWDTVELELSYTSVSVYEQPVRVPLLP